MGYYPLGTTFSKRHQSCMHTHYRGSPNFRREKGRECQNRPHVLKMEHSFPKVHSSTIYDLTMPITLIIVVNFMICGRRTQHAVIQLDLYTQLLQVLGYQILYTMFTGGSGMSVIA